MNGATIPDPQDNEAEQILSAIYWQPWKLKFVDEDQSFHLIPQMDNRPHLESMICDCDPKAVGEKESISGDWFPYFIHNSGDMRELDEWWYYNIQHPELGMTDKDAK